MATSCIASYSQLLVFARHTSTRRRFWDFQTRFFSDSNMSLPKAINRNNLLQIHPAVQQALALHKPVVALESTILAHGMPYPENLQLANKLAALLRARGVEPATIALHHGQAKIGLTPTELQELAEEEESCANNNVAQKCSTRDVALLLARQNQVQQKKQQQQQTATTTDTTRTSPVPVWGATTVASTMALAHAAGIACFVTGGIGGVHRHGESSLDISADLVELSRTPVIVVSAGIKSILDIPRTLEVLETNGVPVVAYQTDEFPAFFSPHSGVAAPARVDSADEIAEAYFISRNDLGWSNGMLVAVPNQDPAAAQVEDAIQAALVEAEEQNIAGSAVTPFLLKRVAEKTCGDSLRSNMALVEQNAVVGAEIAIAIARRQYERANTVFRPISSFERQKSFGVIVLGGSVVDIVAKPLDNQKLILGTSNPASCTESDGGVGRNIAETVGRLGGKPLLYSAVGNDSRGRALLDRLKKDCGVDMPENTISVIDGCHTATYVAVLDHEGDLHVACADMDVHGRIEPPPESVLKDASVLVMDSNPSLKVLRKTAQQAHRYGVKVIWEPTSAPKAAVLARDDEFMACLSYATPNFDELTTVTRDNLDIEVPKLSSGRDISANETKVLKDLCTDVLERMDKHKAGLLVTLGEAGVFLATKTDEKYSFQHLPAKANDVVMNATGAGDSFTGAFVHALADGKTEVDAVSLGLEAASKSLACADRAVPPTLSELMELT